MRTLLAAVAILGLSAAPSLALPSIVLVKTGPTSGRLDVIVTGSGSIAAELSLVDFGGASLTNVAINSAIFDTANPGDSPFIAGSPEGGDSTGLTFEPELGRLFASFGSGVVTGPGTYPFLTFDYSVANPLPAGSSGFTADGFVAQDGVLTDVPGVSAYVDPPVVGPVADFDGNGAVGDGDLTLLLANWGKTVPPVPTGWVRNLPTAPNVGDNELTALLSTWGQGTPSGTSSIPEPAAATIVAGGATMAMLGWSRRRGL